MNDIVSTRARTVIRASSTSGYPDCPRRAATRLIRREIEAAGFTLRDTTSGIGASIGSAVHKAAAVMLQEKAETGLVAPADVAEDAAISELRERVKDGVIYDKATASLDTAELQVRYMQRSFREVAGDLNPVLVERRMECEVKPGLIVSGQADIIAQEPDAVDDVKTGVARSNHKPQLGTYSAIARGNGLPINKAREIFVQRVSAKKLRDEGQPMAQIHEHDIAAAEVAAWNIIRQIDRDITTFREGAPALSILPGDPWSFAANPSSKLCGEKYCSAWGCKGPNSWCVEWLDKNATED